MAILDKENTLNLYDRYRFVVELIKEKNNGQCKNMLIKQIQIPVNLSHSIAYLYLLNNPGLLGIGKIKSELLKEGSHRTYDLLYGINKEIKIEVKASGTSNFQRFRKKAISSNLVIWLKFHDDNLYDVAIFSPLILNAQGKIEVEVNWDNIIKNEEVKLISNLNLNNL
jgi:hypothetical protein